MDERVKRAMDRNDIFSEEEAQNAIDFVMALLRINIADMEENEPHATRSIQEAQRAAIVVMDLDSLLE